MDSENAFRNPMLYLVKKGFLKGWGPFLQVRFTLHSPVEKPYDVTQMGDTEDDI